jgi:hypothetical protein
VRDARGFEPRPGIGRLGQGGTDSRGDTPQTLLVHGDQQIHLGGEMVINGARLHTHVGGDVAERGIVEALAQEASGGSLK